MPNLVNRLLTQEYQDVLAKSEGVIICTLGGVTVHQLEAIRGDLAKEKVRLRMVRNSLVRRVLAERGFEAPAEMLAGNIGVAVGTTEGVIHAAKVLTGPEIKKADKLKLRGAIFDGALLGAADAVALAGLPDKQTLRSQLVGCIQGPLRGLAALLNALPSSTARVLQARVDAQPAGEPSSEGGAAAAS